MKIILARYCVGWDKMVAYLLGEEDGQVRDARLGG